MHWPSSRDTGLISEILGWFEDIGLISRSIAMNLTKGENKPKKDPCPKNKTKKTKNKNTKKKQEEIVVVEEEKNKKRIQYSCVLDLWLQNCIVIDVFVRFIYVIYAWENIGFMIAKLYCHRRFCKIHICNLCLRKYWIYDCKIVLS